MEKLYNINATGALYTNREVVCLDLTGHELTYYEGNKTIKFIHKSYGSFMYLDITIDEISRSESECINIKE